MCDNKIWYRSLCLKRVIFDPNQQSEICDTFIVWINHLDVTVAPPAVTTLIVEDEMFTEL